MEDLIEFLKILVPSGIVLYAMYLTTKSFINKELQQKNLEIKTKNTEVVLPVRLQAYERMCLFLERIRPNNLILRLNDNNYSAAEFHQILLNEIREEYNHNLAQQVYISEEVWNHVTEAKEEIITIINQAAQQLNEKSKSLDLAKYIFEQMMERDYDPATVAIHSVKKEISTYF